MPAILVTCVVSVQNGKDKFMQKLKTKDDIWILTPNEEDLKAGAYYAAVSLPWTFNRMMLNTSSSGQQSRALNIAKGVVGQEMLKREMLRLGIKAQTQRKSYRDEDLFDFHVEIEGVLTKLDLKSIHYFTDYKPLGRTPFSVDLLLSTLDMLIPTGGRSFQCSYHTRKSSRVRKATALQLLQALISEKM